MFIKERNRLFRNCLIAAWAVSSAHLSFGQSMMKPITKSATCFAIVIDQITYDHTKDAVMAYRNMLETTEKLGTYLLIDNWKNPDQVKEALLAVKMENTTLEGAVLIGHIPVALIRNAQHMTTSFKMDEIKYPMEQSSIASDRFYDDFDLRFRFIKKDEKREDWFYYELEESCPQAIQSDIYTARIMSRQKGIVQYDEINAFLVKAVAARNQPQPLDHLLAFTGGGYNSESLTAWSNEQAALKELFPQTFNSTSTATILNFRMDPQMKFRLFSEMQRPEMDLTILSEHGDVTKQYINNLEKRTDSLTTANANILTADLKTFEPASRMVIFNACYNGSFHHPDNIAGAYIFNAGHTLITQGNTVNVLQDKWALEQIGLLNLGVRAGLWAYLSNTLESHLVGDPTWHFSAGKSDLNTRIALDKNKSASWKKLLNERDPVLQALALNQLYVANEPGLSGLLLKTYKNSPYVNVRMECLAILSRIGNKDYKELLPLALQDPYELVRRKAADWCAKSGEDELIAPLVTLALHSSSDERVLYNVQKALELMNTARVKEEIKKQLNTAGYLFGRDELLNTWLKDIQKEEAIANNTLSILLNKQASEKERIQAIRLIRNNTYHTAVPALLTVAEDTTEPAVIRQQLIEALGWFTTSYQQSAIAASCQRIMGNTGNAPEVNKEAMQTIGRLEKWRLQ